MFILLWIFFHQLQMLVFTIFGKVTLNLRQNLCLSPMTGHVMRKKRKYKKTGTTLGLNFLAHVLKLDIWFTLVIQFQVQNKCSNMMGFFLADIEKLHCLDRTCAQICPLHSRGEDFRGKVSDVGGDWSACQELRYFIGEGVAVVLKQTIPVTSKTK